MNQQAVKQIISLVKNLKYCDGLLISLHGANPDSYFSFTRKNSFFQVIDNIKRAVDANIRVATNTVLTKFNFKEILDVIKLAKSLGVFSVAFSRHYGAHLPGVELSKEEFRYAFNLINKLK